MSAWLILGGIVIATAGYLIGRITGFASGLRQGWRESDQCRGDDV